MSGFGGAGAFSDGKYNITNDFGGTLHEYIGKKKAISTTYSFDLLISNSRFPSFISTMMIDCLISYIVNMCN